MIEWFAPKPRDRTSLGGVFLDRDGVINEHIAGGYVLRSDQFRYLPGAISSLRRLGESGRPLVIVTNQSCINRGLIEAASVRAIMTEMIATLDRAGARCTGWICCPHRPDECCPCRKPGTAMLERAAKATGVVLDRSALIGDSETDIEAAERAGMIGILVKRNDPDALSEAVDRILGDAR